MGWNCSIYFILRHKVSSEIYILFTEPPSLAAFLSLTQKVICYILRLVITKRSKGKSWLQNFPS